MEHHADHMRSVRQKRLLRRVLAASIVFLVFLGGLAAGMLLHQGYRDAQSAQNTLLQQSQTTAPTIPIETTAPTEAPTTTPPTESTAPTQPEETMTLPPEETMTLPPEVDAVQAIMDTMTLEEKLYQLFLVTPEAISGGDSITTAPESLADDLRRCPVGGIVLFGQNLQDREQTMALISAHQEMSRIPLFVGVDEEGGTVSRLGSIPQMGVSRFSAMMDIGTTGETEGAYQVGRTLGHELKALGFNLDFAPVADVLTEEDNPVIGNRAFSTDADVAAQMVRACVQGFQDGGLMSCLKHFPGHGNTVQDSHEGYASSSVTADTLRSREFKPFTAGIEAGVPMIMVGHISLPQILDDQTPATLSTQVVTGYLRTELGFTGLIVTDAMNMGAITENYTPGEAAVLAVVAGCDLILMPEELDQAVAGLRDAIDAGILTTERIEESVRRILTAKLNYGILSNTY